MKPLHILNLAKKHVLKPALVGIMISSSSFNTFVYATDVNLETKPSLRAVDLITSDIALYRKDLDDMLLAMKVSTKDVEEKEYARFRNSLRTEPLFSLRKTCFNLKKYLPSKEDQAKFQSAYEEVNL